MTEYLTVDEVAALLRTTPAGVYNLRHRGAAPPAARVGRRLLFRTVDVERWFDERRGSGGPRAA